MQKIKRLDPQEILKIAAGQVVERPANIVKELIENSIDAGATKITVHIEDGGKQAIRIIDNGCGMSPEDAKLSFEKHATSKIRSLDDLDQIHTFGFRGEALASISAVSKVTLLTKDETAEHGIKLELANGTFIFEVEIPFEQGTDLTIRDLFYNTPVRQKFLKKRETENRHIIQLLQSFCLDYLDISFKLFIDNRQTINCAATNDITKRAAQIWDHTFAKNLVPLRQAQGTAPRQAQDRRNSEESRENSTKKSEPYIHGAITNHQYFRYDRNNIFLFVNNRWVKNYEIQSALLKGYINVLPPARYPAAFIFIEVNPSLIDVNIHPRKEEVKFLHPKIITSLLQQAVKKALEEHLSNQIQRNVTFKTEPDFHSQPPFSQQKGPDHAIDTRPFIPQSNQDKQQNFAYNAKNNANQNNFEAFNFDDFLQKSAQKPNASGSNIIIPQTKHEIQEHRDAPAQAVIQQQSYNIIGQFKKTYILIEKLDGLFFVDQHAAHERILYEIFSKRFEEVATIKLLFPQIITLKQEDIQLIEPHLDIFRHNGIDIELFGETQLKIQATPVHLKSANLQELVQEVLSWILEFQALDAQDFFKKINEKMHAQMACKAAIKAGDILTVQQMEQLLKDLETTNNRFACPHGRPTGWILTLHDIEKKFRRKA